MQPAVTTYDPNPNYDPEAAAIVAVASAFAPLDDEARGRVLDWVRARFGVPAPAESAAPAPRYRARHQRYSAGATGLRVKDLLARVFLANGNTPLTLREAAEALPELAPGTVGPAFYRHTGRFERVVSAHGHVRWRMTAAAWAAAGGGARPAEETP